MWCCLGRTRTATARRTVISGCSAWFVMPVILQRRSGAVVRLWCGACSLARQDYGALVRCLSPRARLLELWAVPLYFPVKIPERV